MDTAASAKSSLSALALLRRLISFRAPAAQLAKAEGVKELSLLLLQRLHAATATDVSSACYFPPPKHQVC